MTESKQHTAAQPDDTRAELARLRAENERLRKQVADLTAVHVRPAELMVELGETTEALGGNEEHFRALVEDSYDGINIYERTGDDVRPDRKLLYCNDRYVEMSGRTREELMAARNLNDFCEFHTSDEQIERNRQNSLLGRPCRGVNSWIRPDGKENYYEWVSLPVTIGAKRCYIGIDRDITERREAENRQILTASGLCAVVAAADEWIACPTLDAVLRRSVELAREGLGLERCGVLIMDGDDLRLTYGTNLAGQTTDERAYRFSPTGPPWPELLRRLAPDGPPWLYREDRPLWEWNGEKMVPVGRGWVVLTPIRAQSGGDLLGVFCNDAAATGASMNETVQQILAVYCSLLGNIIQRKRAEQDLRASEERYRALVEHSAVGVWHITPEGHTVYVNPAMCKMLEIGSPDALEGQTYHSFFTSDSLETMQEEHAKRPAGTASMYEVELVGRRGTHRNILLCGAPLFSAGEQLAGLIGTFIDVTERRHLEAQLLHAQKLESLGVLAGGIAHDFNNILMVILGSAELALNELSPVSPARKLLDDICAGARRAADLCRQMLAYAGKGRFVVEALDLREVIREMAHLLEASVSKRVTLRYEFAENTPMVEADATQMRQIIMNLVVNASEASEDRNGLVSIATGVIECDRQCLSDTWLDDDLPEGPYVYLEVADTGCGMDAATQAKMFDPFFTTKFQGRGLGLSAVLGIVQGHKGSIKVYSEEGAGSTVKILLPASDRQLPDAAGVDDDSVDVWQGQGTVLVVDDEEAVRDVAKRMVEPFGLEVLTANDGRQALAVYREHRDKIVCVLLDLTMPDMDGKEAFRELRRIDPQVPVIIASGYNEQEIRQRFAGKAINGFVQKPYQLAALRSRLAGALSP